MLNTILSVSNNEDKTFFINVHVQSFVVLFEHELVLRCENGNPQNSPYVTDEILS